MCPPAAERGLGCVKLSSEWGLVADDGTGSKETEESSLMWLVFGLAVGIPLAIVIVCIVSILCYRHHTREKKIHVNDQHRTGPALEENYPDPDYSKPQNHSKMSDKDNVVNYTQAGLLTTRVADGDWKLKIVKM
nr:hypothetical protein BaRGS_017244 [Batillaria attramentaria]